MTFMELMCMPENDQMKWIAEHSEEEYRAIFDEWLEAARLDSINYKMREFRERRKLCEISQAVLNGLYAGITSDGTGWRIKFIESDSDFDNDDWRYD